MDLDSSSAELRYRLHLDELTSDLCFGVLHDRSWPLRGSELRGYQVIAAVFIARAPSLRVMPASIGAPAFPDLESSEATGHAASAGRPSSEQTPSMRSRRRPGDIQPQMTDCRNRVRPNA
jgi:hypothetical protein